jgi:type IV pilus secretin PilQ/predicted competence protein
MRPSRWTLLATTLVLVLGTTIGQSRTEEVRAPAAKLEDVSIIAQGDRVVVRLKTSQPRRYRADLIDTPYRLVLDLEDTTYAWRKTPLVTTAGPLVQIRGSQYRKDVARVVLELRSRVPYSVREEGDSLLVVFGTSSGIATPAAAPPPVAAVATAPASIGRRGEEISASAVAQAAPATHTVAPAPTVPPTTAPVSREQLISLEFKDAEVVNLLRILAAESGRNIVIGDDVKGRMSISLRNVPWTLALQTILEARGLERIDRDGVIRIVSIEQLTKEREGRARIEEAKVKAEVDIRTKRAEAELKEHEVRQRQRTAEAAEAEAIARGPLTEAAIRLAYADPGEVASTLQGLLGLSQTASDIPPCRVIIQTPGKRTVTVTKGGGGVIEGPVRGPIAEPPFSQLFGPPREEGSAREPPPSPEEVISRRRAVRAHCATNTLFLRLHATDMERVRKLIREAFDVPVPQVKIEARMEILERDDLFAIGVQWGGGAVGVDGNRNAIVGRGFTSDFLTNPPGLGIGAAGLPALSNPNLTLGQAIPVSAQSGLPLGGNLINLPIGALLQGAAPAGVGGLAFGIIGSKMNLNLALEALRTQGKTVTLARPDIVTLENNLARISLGEEIPFATVSSAGTQVQFKEALLQLTVIPTVVREATRNRIRMTVVVENNSRGNVVNLGSSGAPPAINRRSAETDVLINEGDHLVIGGIMTSVQSEEIRKVPLFGDIPILGWLFKQRGTQQTRRELAVFITPTVLKTDASPPPSPPQPAPAPAPAR